MKKKEQIDQYLVVGNPIAHSKSPLIHALFAEQTGQRMQYATRLVEIGDFANAIDRFRDQENGKGLNVTLPFKQDAWAYAERRSERAQRAGAVNTLVLREGEVFGDNTDGLGLVHDVKVNHAIALVGKRLLVLGAGGATRGVLQPLLMEQPESLVIANRTENKARELAQLFADVGNVSASGFAELTGQQFEVIINATSAGLQNAIPPLPDDALVAGGCCYDMLYSDQPTAFVRWGLEHGAAKSLDGLGMLVEQAAESFTIWRGVRPETSAVYAVLRAPE